MQRIVVGEENTESLFALVDDEDYPLLSRIKWYPMRVRGGDKVYAQRLLGRGNTELMHHLVFGRPPSREKVVDHINDNGLDNRKENLRFLWNSENIRRRYEGADTGLRCHALLMENPWQASVSLGGKTRHVGYFPTKELAKEARDKAIEDFIAEQEKL